MRLRVLRGRQLGRRRELEQDHDPRSLRWVRHLPNRAELFKLRPRYDMDNRYLLNTNRSGPTVSSTTIGATVLLIAAALAFVVNYVLAVIAARRIERSSSRLLESRSTRF